MAIEVKLPDLGEGIESGDVLEVLVQPGDQIGKDQSVVELETDKATVEVPSSHAGRVAQVLVSAGQTVKVGDALLTLEISAAAATRVSSQPAPPAEDPKPAAPTSPDTPTAEPQPAPPAPAADISTPAMPVQGADTSAASPAASPAAARPSPSPRPSTTKTVAPSTGQRVLAAGPAMRRFAREVGVDLTTVTGSGEGGRITREDVLAAVRRANSVSQQDAARRSSSTMPIDHVPGEASRDDWGPITVDSLSKIRQTIAAKMYHSWSTVPRVTNFDDADVTELEKIRRSSKSDYAAKGIKLTSMPFVIKAVSLALRAHPVVNARLETDGNKIVYRQYVNMGIAVDTARGLIVPVLRSTDEMSIADIARNLAVTTDRVRDNDFTLDELRGSTFTISNLGAIGGTYSTPIINVPEAAILLVGRARKMPVVVDDEIAVRLMLPLSISYDHRLIDGAAAARFLNEVIGYLQAPGRLLLAP